MPLFKRKTGIEKQKQTVTPRSSPVKRTPSNKSQISQDFQNGDIGIADTVLSGLPHTFFNLQDVAQSDVPETALLTSSRLSKTIHEVLHDRDALPYFIQFLESTGDVHLLRFWLDAQSFHAASLTRNRTRLVQNTRRQQNQSTLTVQETVCDNDSEKRVYDNSTYSVNDTIVQHDVDTLISHGSVATHYNNAKCDIDIGNGVGYDKPSQISPVTRHFRDSIQDYVTSDDIGANDDISRHVTDDNQMLRDELPGALPKSILSHSTPVSLADRTSGVSEDDLADKLQKSIVRDAVTIYSKYISLDAPLLINLPEHIRNDAISKICQEDGSVDVTCFAKCQEHVLNTLHTEYFENFKLSVNHYKHQIDLLTSGKVYLADFLYNVCAIFYLTEYLEQSGASPLLQFVVSADNFQQHLQKSSCKYNGDEAQADAMVLYNKYFSLQASCPLGFSDKLRFDIESNICREMGPLPDCFAVARNIILRYIEKMYFGDFLKSEIYYKYLTELISSVQMMEEPAVIRKHRRTGSETSSEYSVGSHSTGADSLSMRNTLLASNEKHWRKQAAQKLGDFSMDDTYLNPDQLWRRSNAGPLKLGQVDQMGRFTSYFQPEPDGGKKKGSRFFKKNSEKLKEEEQMAVKIAQMIISDVTNVTQRDVTDVTQDDVTDVTQKDVTNAINPSQLSSTVT